jgi:hypothetical protein
MHLHARMSTLTNVAGYDVQMALQNHLGEHLTLLDASRAILLGFIVEVVNP